MRRASWVWEQVSGGVDGDEVGVVGVEGSFGDDVDSNSQTVTAVQLTTFKRARSTDLCKSTKRSTYDWSSNAPRTPSVCVGGAIY